MSFRIEIKIHFFESTCTFLLLEITKKKKKKQNGICRCDKLK